MRLGVNNNKKRASHDEGQPDWRLRGLHRTEPFSALERWFHTDTAPVCFAIRRDISAPCACIQISGAGSEAIFYGGAQHSDHRMAYNATAKLPPGILIRCLQRADFSAVERQRPHRMASVHAFDGAQTFLEPGF